MVSRQAATVQTAPPDQELHEGAAVGKARCATAGLITLDRSLEAPAPDKGLAPQGRGLSYVEVGTCERAEPRSAGGYRTRSARG
jgi:hypothetical protein